MIVLSRKTLLFIGIVLLTASGVPASAQSSSDTLNVLIAVAQSFPSEKHGKKVGLSNYRAAAIGQPPKAKSDAEKTKEKQLLTVISKGRFVMVDEAGPDKTAKKEWLRSLRQLASHFSIGAAQFTGNQATVDVYEGSAFKSGDSPSLEKMGLKIWRYTVVRDGGTWAVSAKELVQSTTFIPEQ